MLALLMAVPASAQTPAAAPAEQEAVAARGDAVHEVQYRQGGAPRRMGGWQRQGGARKGHRHHRRPTVAGLALRFKQELGLSTQQVDALKKIGFDARRAAIKRSAERKLAQLDLMETRMADKVDMGKVESEVRKIEKIKADGTIARIRANEQAKAQLTPEQREKLKNLLAERMKAMRERMQQRMRPGGPGGMRPGSGGMEPPDEGPTPMEEQQ